MKYRLKMNLQQFSDEVAVDSGVEVVPAAEVQTESQVEQPSEPGVNTEVAAEPEKPNNFEKAFAKRLAAEREKWDRETADKYKDYDVLQKATQYLQKTSGINDIMTLKEEIELAELQERADQANVPPEVLKRIDELEVKAAKADEIETQQKQQQEWMEFEGTLKTFCEGKEIDGKAVDHMELWNYMHENGVSKPEIAFKAMKTDVLEQRLATAKEDSVKEYLASKQAPRVEGGNGAAGNQQINTAKMSWSEVERVAAERLRAARQPS